MDGMQGVECSELAGALWCDRCEPPARRDRADTPVGTIVDITIEGRWRSHVGKEVQGANMLWDWLDDVEVNCVPCLLFVYGRPF